MIKKIAIIAYVSSFVASPAFAADKFDWSPCKTEVDKWCKDIKEGDDEGIYQCLLKHDADISKECDTKAHNKYEQQTGKVKK